MADAVDSKSTGYGHAGSSPALGTIFFVFFLNKGKYRPIKLDR